MPQELRTPITGEINELYQTLKDAGELLLASSIRLGELLYQADQTPGFDFGEIQVPEPRQQTFRNFFDRREELQQLDFLGTLKVPALRTSGAPRESGPPVEWMGFLTPLCSFTSWIQKKAAQAPVEQWPAATRESLRIRLKPLVDLYSELE